MSNEPILPPGAKPFEFQPPAQQGGPVAQGPAPPAAGSLAMCQYCDRPWGDGLACQFCNQVAGLPEGMRLATVGRRLGGYLLELVLLLVTLIVGWVVWSLIVWARGQTPSKQLLGMRCVKTDTRAQAGWGTMFVREFLGKIVVMNIIGLITFGIAPLILNFRVIWHRDRQELWDSIADTIVVRTEPTSA